MRRYLLSISMSSFRNQAYKDRSSNWKTSTYMSGRKVKGRGDIVSHLRDVLFPNISMLFLNIISL